MSRMGRRYFKHLWNIWWREVIVILERSSLARPGALVTPAGPQSLHYPELSATQSQSVSTIAFIYLVKLSSRLFNRYIFCIHRKLCWWGDLRCRQSVRVERRRRRMDSPRYNSAEKEPCWSFTRPSDLWGVGPLHNKINNLIISLGENKTSRIK